MPNVYNLCQYNKARTVAPLADPRMADFIGAQAALYAISDRSPGFVWRLGDGVESVRPFYDMQVVVGLSVWTDVSPLKAFAYGTAHGNLMRRRREWFEPHAGANLVLWWKRAGELPTIAEAEERLAYLQEQGSTAQAFDFTTPFAPPSTVLGTLGPEGTNSQKAAREYLLRAGANAELRLFDTFEQVAAALIDRTLDKAVICTAYIKFSALYFERVPELHIAESFVANLHPMVIATRPSQAGIASFTAQPAILPLVRGYLAEVEYVPAASNASAAHDVVAARADAALTTEVAAVTNGLVIAMRMPPLQIPFAIFERAEVREPLPRELAGFFRAPSPPRAAPERIAPAVAPDLQLAD